MIVWVKGTSRGLNPYHRQKLGTSMEKGIGATHYPPIWNRVELSFRDLSYQKKKKEKEMRSVLIQLRWTYWSK